jgi:FkbM family methyltransferase
MIGTKLELADIVASSRDEAHHEIRKRCTSSYLGDHRAVCRVLGRYIAFVDTTDVGFATHLLMDGAWEMWLTEYMIRTIKPGWTVFDVGANFGYYSLLMADLVGHTGRCVAYEPNPHVARFARESLSVNGFGGWTEVREVALSREAGSAIFYLPHGEPKNARIVDSVDPVAVASGWGQYIDVIVRPLDQEFGGKIDFLKIDAEGAEGAIIHGMWNTIQAHHPKMIIEFNIGRMSDPLSPLQILSDAYGSIRSLEMDGSLPDVSIDRILSERVGEDWLLEVG